MLEMQIKTPTARGGLCAGCGQKKAELCPEHYLCEDCACCVALRRQIREMEFDAFSEPAEELDA